MDHRKWAMVALSPALLVLGTVVAMTLADVAWSALWGEAGEAGWLAGLALFIFGLMGLNQLTKHRSNAWIPLAIGIALGTLGGPVFIRFAAALVPGLLFTALWTKSSTAGPMADHEQTS